jgi:hypothetical protein
LREDFSNQKFDEIEIELNDLEQCFGQNIQEAIEHILILILGGIKD